MTSAESSSGSSPGGGPGALASATLLGAATMTIMAGATIAPSLPAMAEHFGAGTELRVRLLVTITALAIAIAAPVAGFLGDRVGRVPVLFVSVALYVAAGGAGLVLSDLLALQISRVVLGFAVAGVMTSVSALIGDLYEGPARDRMLGFQGAAMGFGGVVFLGLGGLLAGISWRGPFAIYLLPLVLLALIPLALGRARSGSSEPDSAAGNASPLPIGTLALICTAAFIGMIGFYAVPVQLPFLLTERGNSAPAFSGAMMAGMTLVSAVTGLAYGWVARMVPLRGLAVMAFASIAIGLGLIWLGSGTTYPGLAGLGFGMGLLMPTLSRWLLSVTPPMARGRVMGALTTAIFAGQFASPLILAPVIANSGLASGFLAASVLALFVAILLAATRPATTTTGRPAT
ncbi:MFS transporter [Hoeflea sp. AS60]|uniref:MFS transporter n=1 Tax=Hoeflea sp. AS60 TaxID=3135780 RepID=UPI00316D94BF